MMKRSFWSLVIVFAFSDSDSFSQTTPWLWARSAGSATLDESYSVASDKQGRIYITGLSYADEVYFGSYTLTTADPYKCLVASYDKSGNLSWVASSGGSASASGYDICVDLQSNSYVVGKYTDLMSFNGHTISSQGTVRTFIVKLDSTGSAKWLRSTGLGDQSTPSSVAVDQQGNVSIAGRYLLSGKDYYFVRKYDSDGNQLWTITAEGLAHDIAFDKQGNLYVTGVLGPFSLSSPFFLSKISKNGGIIWTQSSGESIGRKVAIDNTDNVTLVGSFSYFALSTKTLVATPPPNGYPFTMDMFIARYDSAGKMIWIEKWGGNLADYPLDATTDINGNLFIVSNSLQVLKYSLTGNQTWHMTIPVNPQTSLLKLAADIDGNLCFTGTYFDTIILGTSTISAMGSWDIFTAKLDKKSIVDYVGIDEQSMINSDLLIFPNPSSGSVFIKSPHIIKQLNIFNAMGQIVDSFTSNSNDLSLKINGEGLHFIETIGYDGKKLTKKVVVTFNGQ